MGYDFIIIIGHNTTLKNIKCEGFVKIFQPWKIMLEFAFYYSIKAASP